MGGTVKFPVGSVWEADTDATDTLSVFVVVYAEGDLRTVFSLATTASHPMFDFMVGWPFADNCKRIA